MGLICESSYFLESSKIHVRLLFFSSTFKFNFESPNRSATSSAEVTLVTAPV